jgi:hypothetical protein
MQRNLTSNEFFLKFKQYWLTSSIVRKLRTFTTEAFWRFYLDLSVVQRKECISWLVEGSYPLDELSVRISEQIAHTENHTDSVEQETVAFVHGLLCLIEGHPAYREYLFQQWLNSLQSANESNEVLNYLGRLFVNPEFMQQCIHQFPKTLSHFLPCIPDFGLLADCATLLHLLLEFGGAERLLQSGWLVDVARQQAREQIDTRSQKYVSLINTLQRLFFSADHSILNPILAAYPLVGRQLYSNQPCSTVDEAKQANVIEENFFVLSDQYSQLGQFLSSQAGLLNDNAFVELCQIALLKKPRHAEFLLAGELIHRFVRRLDKQAPVMATIAFDLNKNPATNLYRALRRYYRDQLKLPVEEMLNLSPLFYPTLHMLDPVLFLLDSNFNSSEASAAKNAVKMLLQRSDGWWISFLHNSIATAGAKLSLEQIRSLIEFIGEDSFREQLLNDHITALFSDRKKVNKQFKELADSFYDSNQEHLDFSGLCRLLTANNRAHYERLLLRSTDTHSEERYCLIWVGMKYSASHAVLTQYGLLEGEMKWDEYVVAAIKTRSLIELLLFAQRFPAVFHHYYTEFMSQFEAKIEQLDLLHLSQLVKAIGSEYLLVEDQLQNKFISLVQDAEHAQVLEMNPALVSAMLSVGKKPIAPKFQSICERQDFLHRVLQLESCTPTYIKQNESIFSKWCESHTVYLGEQVEVEELKKLRNAKSEKINLGLVRSQYVIKKLHEQFKSIPPSVSEMSVILTCLREMNLQSGLLEDQHSFWADVLQCFDKNAEHFSMKKADVALGADVGLFGSQPQELIKILEDVVRNRGGSVLLLADIILQLSQPQQQDDKLNLTSSVMQKQFEDYFAKLRESRSFSMRALLILAKTKNMNLAIWTRQDASLNLEGIQCSDAAQETTHVFLDQVASQYTQFTLNAEQKKLFNQVRLRHQLLEVAIVMPALKETILKMRYLTKIEHCISQNLVQLLVRCDAKVREAVCQDFTPLNQIYRYEMLALSNSAVMSLPPTPTKSTTSTTSVSRIGLLGSQAKLPAARELKFNSDTVLGAVPKSS